MHSTVMTIWDVIGAVMCPDSLFKRNLNILTSYTTFIFKYTFKPSNIRYVVTRLIRRLVYVLSLTDADANDQFSFSNRCCNAKKGSGFRRSGQKKAPFVNFRLLIRTEDIQRCGGWLDDTLNLT